MISPLKAVVSRIYIPEHNCYQETDEISQRTGENMKKVTFLEFNLAPSGHAWLLELVVNGQVVAEKLLHQENAPSLGQQREFRNSQPHQGGVVNFHHVIV